MAYPTRTIDDILNCNPCIVWNTVEKVEAKLGIGWEGSIEDLLNHPACPTKGKIWFIIMSGDLPDSELNVFSTICKSEGPLENTEVPVAGTRRKLDGTVYTSAQIKAVIYHTRSIAKAEDKASEATRQLSILRTLIEK